MKAYRKELLVVFLAHRFIPTQPADITGNLEAMTWVLESMEKPQTWNPIVKLWYTYIRTLVKEIVVTYQVLADIGVSYVGEIEGVQVEDLDVS